MSITSTGDTVTGYPDLETWANVDLDLLERTMQAIEARPAAHRQGYWGCRPTPGADPTPGGEPCQTAFCLAGHALALSGRVTRWVWSPWQGNAGWQQLRAVKLDRVLRDVPDAANRVLRLESHLPLDLVTWWWDQTGRSLPRSLYHPYNTRIELRDVVDAVSKALAERGTP